MKSWNHAGTPKPLSPARPQLRRSASAWRARVVFTQTVTFSPTFTWAPLSTGREQKRRGISNIFSVQNGKRWFGSLWPRLYPLDFLFHFRSSTIRSFHTRHIANPPILRSPGMTRSVSFEKGEAPSPVGSSYPSRNFFFFFFCWKKIFSYRYNSSPPLSTPSPPRLLLFSSKMPPESKSPLQKLMGAGASIFRRGFNSSKWYDHHLLLLFLLLSSALVCF